MRTLLPLAVFLALGLALASTVRGEDPVSLDARVDALQREVQWLRAREAKLTAYLVANGARAEGLETLTRSLRNGGFASHANPTPTREVFVRGIEEYAASLKTGLPTLTEAERAAQATFAK
jgi:hypothetical protein